MVRFCYDERVKYIRKVRKLITTHRKLTISLGCVAAVGLIAILLNYLVIGRNDRYVLSSQAQISQIFGHEKPVGVVLGGGIEEDKPMPLLQDRLDTAASLLKSGQVRKLIVSGDNTRVAYDEPTVMREYLIREKAIDPSLIQPDYAGRSTYETCERAKKIFDLNKALLISESTHLPRAVYLCRSFGLEAYGFRSDGQSSAGLKVGQRWREVLARAKATLNVYLLGEKTILGDKIWQTTFSSNPFTPPSTPQTYVQQKLATMSLRDKVASLFILHAKGSDPGALTSYISAHKTSGLIFMRDNIPSSLQALRTQTRGLVVDKQLVPFTAIDQEGDTVKRLPADDFPGGQSLRDQPPEATRSAFAARSELLRSVGLNLNFGIVADITADKNSFIYDRVLGSTPQAASERVTQAVIGSRGKTLSTLKHFPGHGESSRDSHTSIPTASTSYKDWKQRVAPPFQAGIDAEADMIMFGHLRYTSIDPAPATLSKKWHQIARKDLGFKGLIITDDMVMLQNSGETAYADPVGNAVAALAAGNDILLYVLDHDSTSSNVDAGKLIDGVVEAVNSGRLDSRLIDERAQKVLALRHHLANVY